MSCLGDECILIENKDKMDHLTIERLYQAYINARKSRKSKYEVYLFDQNREERILRIFDDIKNRRYKHSPYKELVLNDSKKRNISSPIFVDHIIHHFVYDCIYKELDNKMVYSTFACRKWYWLHKWVLYLKKIIWREGRKVLCNGQKDELYYLKMDFSKFFFSINHDCLKKKIRRYIFDEDVLYIMDIIIDSYKSGNLFDDVLARYDYYIGEPNKGLPIWWILSQILANFYLNDLDQYLKHILKLSFVRYMDDIIIVWPKSKLLENKKKIIDFIEHEKLIIHPRKISFHPVACSIRFTWYKIKDNRIFAWKRIKLSYQKFMDDFKKLNLSNIKLNSSDEKSISCKFHSRAWCFMITDFWNSYLGERGAIDFHPWR